MTAPSLIILGTDVVLAATPATPVQLAHACLAAGYHAVIPSSWGDELIAARALDRLMDAETSLVQCSCPLVARRLSTHESGIEPLLFSVVAPPVATATYLRAIYAPARPLITFAGACAAGGDASIDVWLLPNAFFAQLSDQGITLDAQPTEFDAVLPPDRRRFFSDPGGVPSQEALHRLTAPVERRDLGGSDLVVDVAQWLLSDSRSLIDLAPAVGCSCSGVNGKGRAEGARARIRELEPPRAFTPVVDHTVPVALEIERPESAPQPPASSTATAPVEPPTPQPRADQSDSTALARAPSTIPTTSPRRTPQPRPVLGSMPQARTDGRQLPRAYVARRRSSPRNVPQVRSSPQRGVERAGNEHVTATAKMKWIPIVVAGLLAGLILSWLVLTL